MNAQERAIPSPESDPETEAFWNAARDGKLMVGRCNGCAEPHYYPRTICPFCGSDDTALEQVSGKGTIYSYSVMRRAKIPYAMAYVTLAEGPTMMTNIVECDLDGLTIGQAVELVFKPTEDADGAPVPMFKPA